MESNAAFLSNKKFSGKLDDRSEKPKNDELRKTDTSFEKSFAERWKTNRFWLVKGSYYILHTVWMIVMIVGGFIAWLISLLFI
ncbi:hypothetical protein EI546_01325 [Aequorivita sp. H23M31]|uniref:Uncharacterized protein n=1 Tax=Aequorivita ciconiae TaxID=2494375 RepID=A0A410FZN6_9FLAO|nr:hypothetical protein [Aequorivita sp. H23M31]QAA80451.1 hypothetical protein EI546_01325 [Aequorivita sp. H23M31]